MRFVCFVSCLILMVCLLQFLCGCSDNSGGSSRPAAEVVAQLQMTSGPEGMAVYGDSLYVCETGWTYPNYARGQIRIYDRNTLDLLDSVQVGVNPQFAAVDTFGRLHVVCTGDFASVPGEIYVIDPRTRTVVQVLAVGGSPNTVSFGANRAYVAAGGFGDSGQVFCYRLDNLAILNDASNPIGTGSGAVDVVAQTDGSFYVSCFQVDEVQHYDSMGTLLQTYYMSDGPLYMASYGEDTLYVVQSNDESLARIDLSTGAVSRHVLSLGLYSNEIVRHGSNLYVANSGDNAVQEIYAPRNQTLREISVSPGINPWTVTFLNEDSLAVSCLVSRQVLILKI